MIKTKMTCGIIYPHRTEVFPDDNGCILPEGHDGPHIFHQKTTYYDRYIQWETDYDCNCEDCQSEDPDNWCVIYSECPPPNTKSQT